MAHCGGDVAGNFIQSLAVTDVATGRVEAVPLITREQSLATSALDATAQRLPVPIRGIGLGQRQRLHLRAADRLLPRPLDGVHSLARLPLQRPGLHRAEERGGHTSFRRSRPLQRSAGRAGPGPAADPGRAVREFLPALGQTGRQAAGGEPNRETLRPSADALPAPAGPRQRRASDCSWPSANSTPSPCSAASARSGPRWRRSRTRKPAARCRRKTCPSSRPDPPRSGAGRTPDPSGAGPPKPASGAPGPIPWPGYGPKRSPAWRGNRTPTPVRSWKS